MFPPALDGPGRLGVGQVRYLVLSPLVAQLVFRCRVREVCRTLTWLTAAGFARQTARLVWLPDRSPDALHNAARAHRSSQNLVTAMLWKQSGKHSGVSLGRKLTHFPAQKYSNWLPLAVLLHC